jgi:release factor glutamine methyltransferase
VRTAQCNAARLGLAGRVSFAVGTWAQAVAGRFDAIVANPPYIPSPEIVELPYEVRDYDPNRALDGGAEGLAAYQAIGPELPRLLAPGGFFATEIGSRQADAVGGILGKAGLRVDAVVRDLAGLPRCIVTTASPA